MHLHPYLFFDGQCEAAFQFYAKCLHGEIVMSMKYGDGPGGVGCDGLDANGRNRIMHTSMRWGGAMLQASDCPPGQYQKPQGLAISVDVDDPQEAERIFRDLSENAQISMPMAETFWAQRFGMLRDQFGTPWMIGCNKAPEAA